MAWRDWIRSDKKVSFAKEEEEKEQYGCNICGKRFYTLKECKEHEKTHDLNKDVKTTGIILIVLGVLHLIFSGFFNPTWAIVLIPIGITCLFYRSRVMLLLLGVLLIIAGLWNFSITTQNALVSGSSSNFWSILGFFQIYWGIKEIGIFRRTKENPKYIVKETKDKGFTWYGLRIGFWILVGVWVFEKIMLVFNLEFIMGNIVFAIFEWVLLLFVFIISIIHLVKYKKKDFAVISLTFSLILILLTVYSLTYLIFVAPNQSMSDLFTKNQISHIEDYCSSSCSNIDSATNYLYYYNITSGDVECECIDSYNKTLKQFTTPSYIAQNDMPIIKTQTITTTVITGGINPDYVVFRPFIDQTTTRSVKFSFSSNLPINVYFVPSSEDYNKFMANEQYDTYQNCFFEEKTSESIDCSVSTGGMILYNPNSQNVTYTIKSL